MPRRAHWHLPVVFSSLPFLTSGARRDAQPAQDMGTLYLHVSWPRLAGMMVQTLWEEPFSVRTMQCHSDSFASHIYTGRGWEVASPGSSMALSQVLSR